MLLQIPLLYQIYEGIVAIFPKNTDINNLEDSNLDVSIFLSRIGQLSMYVTVHLQH